MKISGFQKLSLLDYPGKLCSVVFTQGCNFRCPFCHNPELVSVDKKGVLSGKEIIDFLKEKKGFIDAVCITGGEPTLQKELVLFIKKIKKIGLLVKLDTNGSNPKVIKKLIAEKLIDYIAMDVKSSWENYNKIIGDKLLVIECKETMELIQESGISYEFRTTVFPQEHKEQDFFEIAKCLKKDEKYFIQNIEYKKNLNKNIKKVKFNVKSLVEKLKREFPNLKISERG